MKTKLPSIPPWLARMIRETIPPDAPQLSPVDAAEADLNEKRECDVNGLVRAAIVAVLTHCGVRESDELVEELVAVVEGLAWVSGSRLVAQMVNRLPENVGGEIVIRHLLGDGGESVKALARRIGCHPSSLLRSERQFRRFLGLPKNHAPPCC